MKIFVNALSIFRIIASFAIIPTLMYQWYWLTFVLYALAGFSDFFDGWLAKKYKVTSKLGGVLDHIGDKFLVVNTMIMLAAMLPVWFIVVPIIIMIARELYVSGLREFMGTQKIEMPVSSKYGYFAMARIKTFLQMVAVGAFLLMFCLGTLISLDVIGGWLFTFLIYLAPKVGIWGLWISLAASLWSAGQYTITFAEKYKKLK